MNLSELFLPMSECASQVSFTEACLKLRTDASLKEFVEVRVVELYTSSSIILFLIMEALGRLADLKNRLIVLFDGLFLHKSL